MPTRTRQDRLSTALLLLGMVGLVASGVGLFPGLPGWVWLAVLGCGVARPLLSRQAGARRFDAAERRRNALARRNMAVAQRNASRRLSRHMKAVSARLDGVLTPEQAAQLVRDYNAMALDLDDFKRKTQTLWDERSSQRFGILGGRGPGQGVE